QLVELDLAIDVRLHVGHVALQPAGEVAERARDARQPLRPDHDQRDHRNYHQLRKSDVEHGSENKKAPGGALVKISRRPSGLRLGLALDLALYVLARDLRRRAGRVGRLAALAHAVLAPA